MPGRTWIIGPDRQSLEQRWQVLVSEKSSAKRAALFHPHFRRGVPGDRHIDKPAGALANHHDALESISDQIGNALKKQMPVRIIPPILQGYRSFDRQWIIPDKRLINQANPELWDTYGSEQVFLTGLMANNPDNGPAVTLTSLIPDLSHYKGSFGGRTFRLWRDAAATNTNVADPVLAALSKLYGGAPDPVDVFAYVAALLAHPAYTNRFRADLVRPGLRVPLTADRALFDEAALLGREVIWLHSFGDRMAEGRPAGPPRLPGARRPKVTMTIPATPDGFPDTIDWDADTKELKVGGGRIGPVSHATWAYQVSGKQVLRQWFSYRKKNRERPQIGDRRPPSPLGDIQPDHWLPEYTEELLNVLNVLGLLIDLEPRQGDVLERIVDGPLVSAGQVGGGAE